MSSVMSRLCILKSIRVLKKKIDKLHLNRYENLEQCMQSSSENNAVGKFLSNIYLYSLMSHLYTYKLQCPDAT